MMTRVKGLKVSNFKRENSEILQMTHECAKLNCVCHLWLPDWYGNGSRARFPALLKDLPPALRAETTSSDVRIPRSRQIPQAVLASQC